MGDRSVTPEHRRGSTGNSGSHVMPTQAGLQLGESNEEMEALNRRPADNLLNNASPVRDHSRRPSQNTDGQRDHARVRGEEAIQRVEAARRHAEVLAYVRRACCCVCLFILMVLALLLIVAYASLSANPEAPRLLIRSYGLSHRGLDVWLPLPTGCTMMTLWLFLVVVAAMVVLWCVEFRPTEADLVVAAQAQGRHFGRGGP